jgi:hypothetical protein
MKNNKTTKTLTALAVSTLLSAAALAETSDLTGGITAATTINSINDGSMTLTPSSSGKGTETTFTFVASSNVPWTITVASADEPAGLSDQDARYLRSGTDYIQYRVELDRAGYNNADNDVAAIAAAAGITPTSGTLDGNVATFNSLETSEETFTVHLQSDDVIDYATDSGTYTDTLTITATAQ